MDIITDTLYHVGFDEQTTKTVGLARIQVFLGLEVNAKYKIIRLHDDRKSEIMDDLHEWKNRIYATKYEILSIIGKLQFCARVIRNGFMFTRILINISKRARNLHHRIYITSEACADLRCWEECMECHNGIAFFPEPWCIDKAHIRHFSNHQTKLRS